MSQILILATIILVSIFGQLSKPHANLIIGKQGSRSIILRSMPIDHISSKHICYHLKMTFSEPGDFLLSLMNLCHTPMSHALACNGDDSPFKKGRFLVAREERFHIGKGVVLLIASTDMVMIFVVGNPEYSPFAFSGLLFSQKE